MYNNKWSIVLKWSRLFARFVNIEVILNVLILTQVESWLGSSAKPCCNTTIFSKHYSVLVDSIVNRAKTQRCPHHERQNCRHVVKRMDLYLGYLNMSFTYYILPPRGLPDW